ncbi:hypothetical protein GDO78_018472 [Eleutherodactylus coqui]|uniref:Olfactory receptor n=1 Tax=Eleutherodactylus coqui TaxID=57060 RepID=A0A8J6B0S6_ELECQ|nr:hypothetical protein GDO78_018472 [Eleutherodactylus coqui]
MKRRQTPSNGTMFLLLGFSDLSLAAQTSLYVFLLLSYLFSVIGNGLIMLVVTFSPRLQSPMYFFLTVLSFTEILSISSTVPKALQGFLKAGRTISLIGCATQFSIFIVAVTCESILLTLMAYDRYMAICQPLRYTSVMTVSVCWKLTIIAWILAFGDAFIGSSLLFSLPFCDSILIAHFFCDALPIINLTCGNTLFIEVYQLIVSAIVIMFTSTLIICSYVKILTSIFLLRSAESRHKAFSTCGSHLVSVIIFFGSAMFVHFQLGNPLSSYNDRMLALSYSVIIPTINPLIYSLKNNEMKEAIRKLNLKFVALHM